MTFKFLAAPHCQGNHPSSQHWALGCLLPADFAICAALLGASSDLAALFHLPSWMAPSPQRALENSQVAGPGLAGRWTSRWSKGRYQHRCSQGWMKALGGDRAQMSEHWDLCRPLAWDPKSLGKWPIAISPSCCSHPNKPLPGGKPHLFTAMRPELPKAHPSSSDTDPQPQQLPRRATTSHLPPGTRR